MGTMDMNKHLTGDNYDLHSSMVTASSPVGEWNTGRIVVSGNQVEHWLNGQLTVRYEYYADEWNDLVQTSKFDPALYARSPAGSIGIQDHGHDVRYRNIKIKPYLAPPICSKKVTWGSRVSTICLRGPTQTV